jgi:hypothetical protein
VEIFDINGALASSSVRAFVPALSAVHATGVGGSAALALPMLTSVDAGVQGPQSALLTTGIYAVAQVDQVPTPIQTSKPKNSTTDSGIPPRGRPV